MIQSRKTQDLIRWGVVGVAVIVGAAALWWTQVYKSPERAFQDMLVNNLTTSSVTKTELASRGNQNVLQHVTLNLGAVNAARWLVSVKQDNAIVATESVGTPTGGFVRYVKISSDGNKADYSKVLNVWAKATKEAGSTSLQELFSQALLDVGTAPVPPIGNPTVEVRQNLLDYIKNEQVFTPDYKTTKSETINGRQVYSLTVSVKLAPYLKMMQAFAQAYGLKSLQDVNPTDYQAAAPVKLTISIDKTAHTMLRVAYTPTKFVETYSDYGMVNSFKLPDARITTTELQKRLQNARQ